jgi:hypothetical protein
MNKSLKHEGSKDTEITKIRIEMKMKSIIPLFTAFGLLFLAGCSGGAASAVGSAETPAGDMATSSGPLTAQDENALPVQLQLALGTLKLEGTENEVDARMAQELLPLWKAVRTLSSSETAAPEELEALFDQIQETMAPSQLEAIAAMQFNRENMAQTAEEFGLSFGPPGGNFDELTPEQQATLQAGRENGQGFPGGGVPGAGGPPPEGGGIPGGGPGMGPGQGAQGQANQDGSAAGSEENANRRAGFGAGFYEAVIEYLEGKIN